MTTSMTPDEVRAAAEVHSELGPGYSDAVIESFLDKVGKEIDARVDARLSESAQTQQWQPGPYGGAFPDRHAQRHQERMARQQQHEHRGPSSPMAVAIGSLIFAIPLTAIAGNFGGLPGMLVVWLGIAVINVAHVAYALHRPDPDQRPR